MEPRTYNVGELAQIAGVSVRTLHHYDRIGLLSPSERSESGYRRYRAAEAGRLHRILAYRALGIPLDEITTLLDDPGVDPLQHLRRQEALLRDRIGQLEEMLAATHALMEATEMNIDLTPEQRFELFGSFDPAAHAREARERWGATPQYGHSQRRTATYTKPQWRRIQESARVIERDFVRLMAAGAAPEEPAAMDAAEAHRSHISRWYYDCTPQIHRGLGEMYVADPRFRAHYEEVARGLADYVSAAVAANADRREARI